MVTRIRHMLIGGLGIGGIAVAVSYFVRRATQSELAAQALSRIQQQVHPRANWSAVEPVFDNFEERGRYDALTNRGGYRVYDQPLDQILRTVVVHHSALPQSDGPREIQRMHIQDKGYADIGYHFVIDGTGQIYEGRPINIRGAHTGGFNTGSVGICLMGNFENATPTATQLQSLENMIGLLRDAYGITHIAGHRDFQPGVTVCPGNHLSALLQSTATRLGLELGTKGYAG